MFVVSQFPLLAFTDLSYRFHLQSEAKGLLKSAYKNGSLIFGETPEKNEPMQGIWSLEDVLENNRQLQ